MANHTGTDWSDLNWETEEVIDWMMNDEGIYHETEGRFDPYGVSLVVKRHLRNEPSFRDFDWSLVDWEKVIEYREVD